MKKVWILALTLMLAACSSEDIPQAHKGQMFDRTGVLALWSGGDGLTGDVLEPGTYYTGLYDTLRMVDCSQSTVKEPMTALTKDGVQFSLDVYVRFSANCTEDNIKQLLKILTPENGVISSTRLYNTYIRPAIGEAVRVTISPYKANDINDQREKILEDVRASFQKAIGGIHYVLVQETVLNNMDFPEAMDLANTERATQAVLKDKAVAEREKVTAEIETAKMKEQLASQEGQVEAARIDQIGAALRRNPLYVQFRIYEVAGQRGNMIMLPNNANLIVNPNIAAPK